MIYKSTRHLINKIDMLQDRVEELENSLNSFLDEVDARKGKRRSRVLYPITTWKSKEKEVNLASMSDIHIQHVIVYLTKVLDKTTKDLKETQKELKRQDSVIYEHPSIDENRHDFDWL